MDRRTFLSSSVLAAGATIIGGSAAGAETASPPAAGTRADKTGKAPQPTRMERLYKAIADSRLPVAFDGTRFSGAGYDWLVQRGSTAHAFLIGEEHGIAENPKLAGQLFRALIPSGYRNLAIEISPPMAAALDSALMQGPGAAEKFLTTPESRVAFYGMKEEADFLSTVRSALPRQRQVLWGLDYEIGADRHLIAQLEHRRKPAAASAALKKLAAASSDSWTRYEATHDPALIFSFAGDPQLVQKLRTAWPNADADSSLIMETLEQTFAINRLWSAKKGYESNLTRSRFMRGNLLRYWNSKPRQERLFMKFGASHMIRGLSMTDVFDIGTLVPELAGMRGDRSFNMLVLPGPGTQTANLDPTQFKYVPGNRDQYGAGMEMFDEAIIPNRFTLFDTAPLRPIANSFSGEIPLPIWRVIHGFDAVLIMTGSHPSSNL